MSPLLQENGKTPVAYIGGANSLSWSFIGVPRKPSYSASFSPLIFPTTLSFSNLSLYLQLNNFFPRTPTPSPLRMTLDPPELDPGTKPIITINK